VIAGVVRFARSLARRCKNVLAKAPGQQNTLNNAPRRHSTPCRWRTTRETPKSGAFLPRADLLLSPLIDHFHGQTSNPRYGSRRRKAARKGAHRRTGSGRQLRFSALRGRENPAPASDPARHEGGQHAPSIAVCPSSSTSPLVNRKALHRC